MNNPVELILGAARSGKSRYALNLAQTFGDAVTWIATAQALDDEMRERIAQHQAERPTTWRTVETPLFLSENLRRYDQAQHCIVIDCLTLWLSNWLLREQADWFAAEREALLTALAETSSTVLLVSNEVGWGVVPEHALARQFRDEVGRLHQDIAKLAGKVSLLVAGIPMTIKPSPQQKMSIDFDL